MVLSEAPYRALASAVECASSTLSSGHTGCQARLRRRGRSDAMPHAHHRVNVVCATVLAILLASLAACGTTTTAHTYQYQLQLNLGGYTSSIAVKDPPDFTTLDVFSTFLVVQLTTPQGFTLTTDDPKFQCVADVLATLTEVYIFERAVAPFDFFVTGVQCYQAFAAAPHLRPLTLARGSGTDRVLPVSGGTPLVVYLQLTSPVLAHDCQQKHTVCRVTPFTGANLAPARSSDGTATPTAVPTSTATLTATPTVTPTPTPPPINDQLYSSVIPGPGCDSNGATWSTPTQGADNLFYGCDVGR